MVYAVSSQLDPDDQSATQTRTGDHDDHHRNHTDQQADRLAIRELVDAYAHCADRREAEGQKALFTKDTHFVVYMNGQGTEPTQVLDGREALTPVFADLNRYEATQHFNGQSTISLDGDRATGESYCIAHHLFTEDGERKLMLAHLRYGDTFVKLDGAWLFAERNLYADWIGQSLRIPSPCAWPNTAARTGSSGVLRQGAACGNGVRWPPRCFGRADEFLAPARSTCHDDDAHA